MIGAMREFSWSPAEKKIARAAFDRAYERECLSIRREVESMLRGRDAQVIWRVEEYLHKRRREIDDKYDFRYSVLMLLFIRLYAEGLLTDEDLEGLRDDKLQFIKESPAL